MKTMNKKQIIIAAAAAAVVVLGVTVSMMSSAGKKKTQGYYDDLKEQFFLADVLNEGDVSYSVFSGNLTVTDPEIRLVAAQTNGTETFLKGMLTLLAGANGAANETGLAAWSRY